MASTITTVKLARIAVVAAALCVIAGMAPAWYAAIRPDPLRPRDFFADYASARNVLSGRQVYAPLEQSLKTYLGFDAQPAYSYSGHPPTSILLALPLAGLGFVSAGLCWNVISLAALVLSGVILARHLTWPLSVYTIVPAIALLMLWPPLWHHTLYGQQELVLLLLLTLAWAAVRCGRDRKAGVLLGITAAIKLFPGLLLVYFVFRRRWQIAITGLEAFFVTTLLTLSIVGKAAYSDYLTLGRNELSRWYGHVSNASITGFVSKLAELLGRKDSFLGQGWVRQSLILSGECAILALLIAIAFRKAGDLDMEYSAAVTAMLLLSPITWSIYFVLLLLPLGLWCSRLARDAGGGRHLIELGAVWMLMSFPQDGLRLNLEVRGVPWPHTVIGHLLLDNVNFVGLTGFFLLQVFWLLTLVPATAQGHTQTEISGTRAA